MLTNSNITLRPLQEADAAPMAALANNKKIWDNVRNVFPHPYTQNDAQFFINIKKDELPVLTFSIVYENEFTGVIGLVPQTDVYCQSVEVGYWLGEPFWSKGIVSKALELITDYALHNLQYARIYAGVFEFNPASMRVLEKCGYKKEGVFINSIFKNERLWNEHRFAKIKIKT